MPWLYFERLIMQIWTNNNTGEKVIKLADTKDISTRHLAEYVIIYCDGCNNPDILPKKFFLENYTWDEI